jgi:hypothetical protein
VWLKGSTVLVILGSSLDYDENGGREILGAIKILLQNIDIQVLWKISKRGEYSQDVVQDAGHEIKEGSLRLENLLGVEPAAMIETGNIAASVHHGCTNSWNWYPGF